MSARSKPGAAASTRAIGIWLIALLVALVATIQIRSQAEVERSFAGTDTASLDAYLRSPAFVPGATYRVLRGNDAKLGMYDVLRAGGRLDLPPPVRAC